LPREELDALCDPTWYVRHVDQIYDRVLGADRPAASGNTGPAPGARAGEAAAGAPRR
jgi:hypothetical protein